MNKKNQELKDIHKKIKHGLNDSSGEIIQTYLSRSEIKAAEGHTRVTTKVDDPTISTWKTDAKFLKVFDIELKSAFKYNKLTLEDIGLLTLLATYIKFDDNMLRGKNDEYLSQKEIAEILGWSRDKTRVVFNRLLKNDMILRTKQKKDKRKYRYYINPKLIYRGRIIDTSMKNYYSNH